MSTYAGIGSRRAPADVLELCTRIAHQNRDRGRKLRSGHAIGCDQAFELGAGAYAEVFLPWKDFEESCPTWGTVFIMPSISALEVVQEHHPAPHRLSMAGMRLHARNCHIILGRCLNDPVDYVICWTRDEERSGTAMGLRVARAYGIPVYNLANAQTRASWEARCGLATASTA